MPAFQLSMYILPAFNIATTDERRVLPSTLRSNTTNYNTAHRCLHCDQVKADLGLKASQRTINRRASEAGIRSYSYSTKGALTPVQQEWRADWSEDHLCKPDSYWLGTEQTGPKRKFFSSVSPLRFVHSSS